MSHKKDIPRVVHASSTSNATGIARDLKAVPHSGTSKHHETSMRPAAGAAFCWGLRWLSPGNCFDVKMLEVLDVSFA